MSTYSKNYNGTDFNKVTINKNSTLATVDFNITFLSKDFDDLHNLLALLNHYFDSFEKVLAKTQILQI